ncbi:MAG: pentapeptide repeat-containing protein [Acinetobacter sp.]|nr:pentapeptide repeat-containing protein [Acinetobacter sp.]
MRLGGIYILWEIVKEAVKALPHLLHDEHVKLFNKTKIYISEEDNKAEISAYKKAHSLHEQILGVLCAHIRTKTNSKEYLLEYYPSIYKVRYPKQFKETFGENSEHNFLLPKHEKPSNEIQTLLSLLVCTQGDIADSLPVIKLSYKINLSGSIFKGIILENFYFKNSTLSGVNFKNSYLSNRKAFGETELNIINSDLSRTLCKQHVGFQHCDLFSAQFSGSFLYFILFHEIKLDNCQFEYSFLKQVLFQKGELRETSFNRAIFNTVNFSSSNCKMNDDVNSVIFNGSYLTSLHLGNVPKNKCDFSGINTLIGKNERIEKLTNYHELLPQFDTRNRLLLSELSMFIEYSDKNNQSIEIKDEIYLEIFKNNKEVSLLLSEIEQQITLFKLNRIDKDFYSESLWHWSKSQPNKNDIQSKLKKYLIGFDDFL